MLVNEQIKTLNKLAKKDSLFSDQNFISFLDACFATAYSKSIVTKFTPIVNSYIKKHKIYSGISSLTTNQIYKSMIRFLEIELTKLRAADKATKKALGR